MSNPDHCDLCPFAGCPGCAYQPELPGQTSIYDQLEEVDTREPA